MVSAKRPMPRLPPIETAPDRIIMIPREPCTTLFTLYATKPAYRCGARPASGDGSRPARRRSMSVAGRRAESIRSPYPERSSATQGQGARSGRLLGARFAYSRAVRPPAVRTVDIYLRILHEQNALSRRDDAGVDRARRDRAKKSKCVHDDPPIPMHRLCL